MGEGKLSADACGESVRGAGGEYKSSGGEGGGMREVEGTGTRVILRFKNYKIKPSSEKATK